MRLPILLTSLLLLTACSMRQMIYPAPPFPVGAPPSPLEELTLQTPGGEVVVWASPHDESREPRPVFLFFHGNGENLETMRLGGTLEQLAALDIDFAAIDYPGYGRSEGNPSEATLSAAAEAALDLVVARYPGAKRVACGWSLGAAVAIKLAAARQNQLDGLVALSAWTSLADTAKIHFPGFLVDLALSERYDSLASARDIELPALFIHGSGDEIIPVEQGRATAAAVKPARWVELRGSGHNDLLGRPEVWRELAAFVDELSSR